jgi:hypothetical protein
LFTVRQEETAMIAGPAEALTWRRWRDAPRVCLTARSLCRTLAVALVVGTLLLVINQLDVVLAGRATGRVWLKAALTYLVPFLVANYGLLVGSRRAQPATGGGGLLQMRRKRSGQGD